jgi:hypothetical protein
MQLVPVTCLPLQNTCFSGELFGFSPTFAAIASSASNSSLRSLQRSTGVPVAPRFCLHGVPIGMASAIYDTQTVATPDPIDDGTRGPGRQQRARDPVRPPTPYLPLALTLAARFSKNCNSSSVRPDKSAGL